MASQGSIDPDVNELSDLTGPFWSEGKVCDALGTPFAYDQGEGALSAEALSDPPPWDRSRAAVIQRLRSDC